MYRAFSVEINDIYPLICDESRKNIFAKLINNSLDSMYESICRLIITHYLQIKSWKIGFLQ